MANRSEGDGLRVAVVGSGPAGFFAAEALLRAWEGAVVDLYEQWPVPYGLVRFGVAPDHPELKSVTRQFDMTSDRAGFGFYGNVGLGRDVSFDELRRAYHAVILAMGAPVSRRLGIPGETLVGSVDAEQVVGWYNGVPDRFEEGVALDAETAVVVGHGNVSMDVTRFLVAPESYFAGTDIAGRAQRALAGNRVRQVHVIGRRGPAQISFSAKEIEEVADLPGVSLQVDPALFDLDGADEAELAERGAVVRRRALEALKKVAEPPGTESERVVRIHFLRGPLAIEGGQRVEAIRLGVNQLEREGGLASAAPTGKEERIVCGLVVQCIGYRGQEVAGVPFDDARGIVPNHGGRIHGIPGGYVAGWLKHGPRGLIGSNRKESTETVKSLLADLDNLPSPTVWPDAMRAAWAERGIRLTTLDDWEAIDAAERARGQEAGKPREKFVTVAEMLGAIQ